MVTERYDVGMPVVAGSSMTALRWFLAAEMRRLRLNAEITREQAATTARQTVASIGHFETAKSLPGELQLAALLDLYGVSDRQDFFRDLRARAKRGRDWWIGFSGAVPEHLNLFLALESSAVRIESWDAYLVPGLFQTRAVATAMISDEHLSPEPTSARPRGTDDIRERVSQLVELRMARQEQIFEKDSPPVIWSVMSEAALRRRIGTVDDWRDQLNHLVTLSERPTVEIQVLPLASGTHVGAEGTFTILSAPPELQNYPGCVYVEDRIRGHYYEAPEELLTYRHDLARLLVQALRPDESRALIQALAEEL